MTPLWIMVDKNTPFTFTPWGKREPIMLLVNDFTHCGIVGDCQHANNIYSLTPPRETADFFLSCCQRRCHLLLVNKHVAIILKMF